LSGIGAFGKDHVESLALCTIVHHSEAGGPCASTHGEEGRVLLWGLGIGACCAILYILVRRHSVVWLVLDSRRPTGHRERQLRPARRSCDPVPDE